MMTALLALACTGTPETEPAEAVGETEVTPTWLDLGAHEVGALAEGTLTVTNTGDGTLTGLSAEVLDSTLGTSVLITDAALEPGSSALVTVYATVGTAASEFTVRVATDVSLVDVPVSVETIIPGEVTLTPDAIDFGAVTVGCEEQAAAVLDNSTDDAVTIDSLSLEGSSAFSVDVAAPLTLAAGERRDILLRYTPDEDLKDIGTLLVGDLVVSLSGRGDAGDPIEDSFALPSNQLDILFTVDMSTSSAASVIGNVAAFIEELDDDGLDYRLAFVIADNGTVAGSVPYIDRDNSADAADITAIMLSGSYGSYTEMGFTVLTNGISENDWWFRDDARLHLVGLSDEEEQSAYSYSYYVSLFQDLKDDPDDVVVHAIGGDYPGGCDEAVPYTGFYEATVATDGTFLSICTDDWDGLMRDLAAGMVDEDAALVLSQEPVEASIVVEIDGQVHELWSYSAESNAITLTNTPDDGETVTVSYAIPEDCE